VLEPGGRPRNWKVVAEIVQFVRHEHSFDATATEALARAYENATASLGQSPGTATIREIIARRIIAAAMKGERDPDRLSEVALAALARTRMERDDL